MFSIAFLFNFYSLANARETIRVLFALLDAIVQLPPEVIYDIGNVCIAQSIWINLNENSIQTMYSKTIRLFCLFHR